ncbi:MAG: phosphatidylglycerophosphatase A [Opitutia bacterium]|jgi:phosphatidylglycerophosphatase A
MMVAVATLGPLGRLPAPGTWGSAAGLLWWFLLVDPIRARHGLGHQVAFCLLVVLAAVFLCGVAATLIGRKDPPEVILDEAACMPLVFIGLQGLTLAWVLVGFLLFRLLDIAKPLGIARLQKLPSGLGIVADDLAAALVANAALHLLMVFLGSVA